MSTTPELSQAMDEAKKELQKSAGKARNLLKRTELKQRRRLKQLNSKIEQPVNNKLMGILKLLDFDPILDLKRALQPDEPDKPARAAQRSAYSSTLQDAGRAAVVPFARSSSGSVKKQAADQAIGFSSKKIREAPPATIQDGQQPGKPDPAHSRLPAIRKEKSDKPVAWTDKMGRAPASVAQPGGQAMAHPAKKDVMNSPAHPLQRDQSSTKPKADERKPQASLAERRRQWVRSGKLDDALRHRQKQSGEEQPVSKAVGKVEKPVGEKVPSIRTGGTADRSISAVAAAKGQGREQAAINNPIITATDRRQPAANAARTGVHIDPVQAETASPGDPGATIEPTQPPANSTSHSDLARELAEALHLHGIDRT